MEFDAKVKCDNTPTTEQLSSYVQNPLWDELCFFINETFNVTQSIEYSGCSMAPGYNVKFKKSGRSLCTLYPYRGYFDCLIVIGKKAAAEAELAIPALEPVFAELYEEAKPFNNSRWLNVRVSNATTLEGLKTLIQIRHKYK